ncbi:DUF4129 domain-containing protein [Hymenobacter sp. CRA2]|uniref:DUF4129 domain-containing protein n=1 Tax=Hymenobacter sp. CRA2 TaxID=1955620 RepID=UPI00098F7D45|nr:DUF4129 domain-containing protein [Hymenobacter sp. CRA2]OON69746.1 hypothetical protein B0919_07410 [Hymenobacter sp. CRA2]
MPLLSFAAPVWRRYALAGSLLLASAALPSVAAPAPPADSVTQANLPPLGPTRTLPARELARLRADDDLQYREAPPAQNPLLRWWQQFWRWVAEHLFGPGSGAWWKLVFYTLAAVALALIVSQLLGLDLNGLLRRRGRRVPVPFEQLTDDVHEETLPARLLEAEQQQQWRLATRLGYLLVLKALTDRDLIYWQPNKTNHQYQTELRAAAPQRQPSFAELTRQFEYVWYGEFELTAAQYELVQADRQAFLSDLETHRAA